MTDTPIPPRPTDPAPVNPSPIDLPAVLSTALTTIEAGVGTSEFKAFAAAAVWAVAGSFFSQHGITQPAVTEASQAVLMAGASLYALARTWRKRGPTVPTATPSIPPPTFMNRGWVVPVGSTPTDPPPPASPTPVQPGPPPPTPTVTATSGHSTSGAFVDPRWPDVHYAPPDVVPHG